MNSINQDKGFAVLTSVVLLSIASIVFTAQMGSIQLIDNKIVGNYYRNNEAFVNAESGVNFYSVKLMIRALAPPSWRAYLYLIVQQIITIACNSLGLIVIRWK